MENKTEQNCLISVIVPVYNILDCLERCVNSICGQTWKNLEILLVDDGSTDGTGKLCDLLAEKDDRIRVFHKPNGGSSSARNLGISMAKGKWIGFVDSDDWIEPQMYERLYEAAAAAGTSIAQASRDEIDEDYHKRPDVCTPPEQEVTCTAEDFLKTLLLHQTVTLDQTEPLQQWQTKQRNQYHPKQRQQIRHILRVRRNISKNCSCMKCDKQHVQRQKQRMKQYGHGKSKYFHISKL